METGEIALAGVQQPQAVDAAAVLQVDAGRRLRDQLMHINTYRQEGL
jgi:hypothetical protein